MKNKQVLDLGCGRGSKISQLEKRGAVTGVDISSDFINECKSKYPNSNFYIADLEKEKLPSLFYDEIYCLDVIEHVNNPNLLLQNIQQSLKKKGILYLDIPYYISEQILNLINKRYSKEIHHQTIFDFQKIIDLLNKNHLKIINCQYNKFFDNIYLLYFFLKNDHIINQQGDFKLKNKIDELMSFLVQFIYNKDPVTDVLNSPEFNKFNKITHEEYNLDLVEIIKSIKISNEINNQILPKTISLTCQYSKKPENSIFNLKVNNNQKKKLEIFSQKNINKILKEETEKNKKEISRLENELDIIKKSKLFKIWPIYNKLKGIFKINE